MGRVGRNAAALQAFAGDGHFVLAVLKADAYGHGAERVARECARAGIAHFGVACLSEALELRAAGLHDPDVYILSPFLPEEAEAIVRADVIPMVSSREQLDALLDAAPAARRPARCFLKVDTGMGRCGGLPVEARSLWEDVAVGPDRNLRVTGIATHFSSADEPDPGGDAATAAQSEAFQAFLADLGDLSESAGRGDGRGGGVWLSLANSPAALRLPRADSAAGRGGIRGFLIRTGLLLCGIEPYPHALEGAGMADRIAPVLSWKARVTLLRDLPAGATIGYGRTHTLGRASRVATVAAGYADGLSRRLSNTGTVLIRGRRLPIVGRVSMDQCQVDVTDAADVVRLGDVATLLGTDGAHHQSALDMALRIETTPHEPTCALTKRVPRVYVRTEATTATGAATTTA